MKFDLVAFDLDGVLVSERSSWEWVHSHFGVDNSHNLRAFCDGQIDDMEFMRSDIAMWKEVRPEVCLDDIRDILLDARLTPGSVETVARIRETGARTCIISGGIDLLAEHVGRTCGVDLVMSNGLMADDRGRLLGEGILRVKLRDKASALTEVMERFGIPGERCAAVGNSWVDIPMFQVSGFGIAFNPIDADTIKAADVVVESDDLRDILPYLLD